jgi:predicted Rossmann fold nucleotide-binding protein DprA/Smf involved in DNA uptake
MNAELSDNTKAILLLTAPLIVGKSENSVKPMTPSEYDQFAYWLRECGSEPADLLKRGASDVLGKSQSSFDNERMSQLLERGFLLSQALECWQTRAIWVISRADPGYPRRFKQRLRKHAPPVLYGCGDTELLETGGLAVVGSRAAAAESIAYAESIGRLAAAAQRTVVSGEARGVDQAAIQGTLAEDGRAVGVLAGGLENAAIARKNRDALLNERLVLVSPYDPRARFNVGNAMQRNKLVYALADAGLIVDSAYNKGGTWSGAVEQLGRLRFVPVFVRRDGKIGKGIEALLRKGARPWPNPETPAEFRQTLNGTPPHSETETPRQITLLPEGEDSIPSCSGEALEKVMAPDPQTEHAAVTAWTPSDQLFVKVEQLLASISTPTTESDVAAYLQVSKKQAGEWLKRLVHDGKYKRLTRPVRYDRIL